MVGVGRPYDWPFHSHFQSWSIESCIFIFVVKLGLKWTESNVSLSHSSSPYRKSIRYVVGIISSAPLAYCCGDINHEKVT